MAHIVAEKRPRDAKLRVGVDVRVIRIVDLRDQNFEALFDDQGMKMSRSKGVPVLSLQKPSDHAVGWNWIANHLDGGEPESAILIRREFAAQIYVGLFGVLVLVEADWRGMPDIDFSARDRLARPINDARADEQRVARRI